MSYVLLYKLLRGNFEKYLAVSVEKSSLSCFISGFVANC